MTEALYHSDAYLKEFDAVVTAVEGHAVALDRTAFYPGGGGQPNDQGTLADGARTWKVTRVRKAGADVWHELDGDLSGLQDLTGLAVHGAIDWERRYKLMRTHTAMHILCGVIFRDYGASVTGGNMEPLKGRMDFEFETMRQEFVRQIEEKINVEAAAARPVKVKILPREEAFQIPDLIRTKINLLPEGIAEVRTVEIEGLDLQADGGTHVANTREVGPLRIVDYKSKGASNKRLVLALEA
ncbi:MAG: Ala-tRNA(Pro) hydrolase [Chloroflexi bacterium RBG_16_63_12]|nr:MAG: Ala-tRNA(Pro) hydrolase [Chloroflexi bacterium RBG_16_63_12]